MLQCTADSFHPELLDERQPLVCSGFDQTQAFAKLQAMAVENPLNVSVSSTSSESADSEIYRGMKHVCPWMSSPTPIHTGLATQSTATNNAVYKKVDAMVFMIVQTRGESVVWLVHPSHMDTKPSYTEVVLREGTVVCVPRKWSYDVLRKENSIGESQYSILSWKPWLSQCV